MSRIHDISPRVTPEIAVFPGDVPFSRQVSMAFDRGDTLGLSSITSTLHLGAHADAPSHYHPEGVGIDAVDLGVYLGPCRLVRARAPAGARIRREHLVDLALDAPRLLISTGSFPDPDSWRDDFQSLDPGLVDELADAGVRLVGIDTPSVDPADSKDLPTHARLHARGVANLEGLVLEHVPPGRYTLVALPLRLVGADASPLRAVLVEGDLGA